MDVLMPQLGETVAEGKISKWFVAAGDTVKPGDNLFEIETDKVSMEVPAIAAGTLSEIRVAAGEVAAVGTIVAVIAGDGAKAAPQLPPSEKISAPAAKPIALDPFREVRTPERNYGPARLAGGITVTPLARRLAGEAGIDLTGLKGSGPRGRIVARDIATGTKTPSPLLPQAQIVRSVVLTADVEIARALALCADANAAQKTRLELADVIAKAWAMSLRLVPDQEPGIALLIGKLRCVVRHAAQSSLSAIAMERHGAAADETTVSTTISMPDVPGITSIVDVLRPPCTTTLSIGAPRRAPVEAKDGGVRFVDMMTVTLTCDQRAVDGPLGAQLLSTFKGFVEQPVTMLV